MPRRLLTAILALSLAAAACALLPGSTPVPPAKPTDGGPGAQVSAGPATATSEPAQGATEIPTETQAAPAPSVTSFPDPQNYHWAPVVSGLEHPIGIAAAYDGSKRLFIIEQPGRIRIVKDGQLLDTPFLDITGRVGDNGSERGLLG